MSPFCMSVIWFAAAAPQVQLCRQTDGEVNQPESQPEEERTEQQRIRCGNTNGHDVVNRCQRQEYHDPDVDFPEH